MGRRCAGRCKDDTIKLFVSSRKVKYIPICDLGIPYLRYSSQENILCDHTETCIQMSTATLQQDSNKLKQPIQHTDEHKCISWTRYYPVIERTKLIIIATQVTLHGANETLHQKYISLQLLYKIQE